MTLKTAAIARRNVAKSIATAEGAGRRTRKASAAASATEARGRTRKTATAKTTAAEPKLYTVHSLDEMKIDTRIRRLDPLEQAEARELTEMIQRTSVRLWLLVTEAHDRKAHIALGYETWADYARAELNMSESRSYQYLDTGHVMKALAAGGVDIERTSPPPTRVVARVKDRLTDVRKTAEAAASSGDGDINKAIDQGLRALAREPRTKGRPRGLAAAQAAAATVSGGNGNGEGGEVATVTCPACKGSGKVGRDLAAAVRDLMKGFRSG